MKKATIKELAYKIKTAKKNNQPQPIFFLGAGASKTGDIPLASEIVTDILKKHSDNPLIQKLNKDDKTYSKLMECLDPFERDELLKGYISKAKINVTHIYLAQLIKEKYVDYVLTVNFDNLMLRALALFNEFPPTYDMAILKDLTTTSFKEKSVVYLHGQHHGLWLLNTKEEMEKVKTTVPRIIDSIKDKRPWIFIGYSGDDPIFEHVNSLGRFDNGLYWVTYNNNNPNNNVKEFLEKPNTNANLIKGFDADSFMLKLNAELGLEQPDIVNNPFSSLKDMLNNIVDIDDQEHYKNVKIRLETSKKQVNEAIQQFEKGKFDPGDELKKSTEIDLLKKEIINLIIEESYQKENIERIENNAKKLKNEKINYLLADLYFNWGITLGKLAETKEGKEAEDYYNQAFEKYEKAVEIKPDIYEAYNNWGFYLDKLAHSKKGKEADDLYNRAFGKFQKAIEIYSNLYTVFNNWGSALGRYAETKAGNEANNLYNQAFEKIQKAIEIKPDYYEAYYNWGTYLGNLAKIKEKKEAENLYIQVFGKFQKAIEIKPDGYQAFHNWGTTLGDLAETKKGKEATNLLNQAIEKFQKAIEIKPNFHETFHNWGNILGKLAKTKEGIEAEKLYEQAFEKFQKAVDLGGKVYNLACIYAIKSDKENALFYLNRSLEKDEVKVDFVKEDEDWKNYLEDEDFIKLLKKHGKN